ncbi:hypothetical protein BGZ73_000515 [Actinomortierella ambigua]|nr:hypothetical protein BGZ73_000515 [Actinomortierella ambigua]
MAKTALCRELTNEATIPVHCIQVKTSHSILLSATTTSTMAFFKLNKNKTASAASTPAHTPRSSMQTTRHFEETKMTQEQALSKLRKEATLSINMLL